MRRFLVLGSFLFTGLVAMLHPGSAAATVRYVASHGANTSTCGTVVAPCRSISKALERSVTGDRIIVGPGFYGDLNRDGNFLPPNDEAADVGCQCVVSITKAVTVESSGGAAVTVIGAPMATVSAPINWAAVYISAPGVVFGGPGKGFTVRGGMVGVAVGGSDVTVEGNRIVGTHLGISVGSAGVSIVGNVVTDATDTGVTVSGAAAVVTGNVIENNAIGLRLEGVGALVADNHVINNGAGVLLFPLGPTTVRHNVVTGNLEVGVRFVRLVESPPDTVVISNNFAENGQLDGSRCGVLTVDYVVNAERNYWGGAQGPGVGDADNACVQGDGSIDAVPFLTRPVVISSQTGR